MLVSPHVRKKLQLVLQGPGFLDGQNAFMANLAGNMLQQSSSTYLQKGQAFMQSRMGFLSGTSLQYYFNVGSSYGAQPSLGRGLITVWHRAQGSKWWQH